MRCTGKLFHFNWCLESECIEISVVTKSGILDWIEDGRGRGLDGSLLNFCFLIYPSPIDPFFNSFYVLT